MKFDSLKRALYEKIRNTYYGGHNEGWILGVALEPYTMALGYSASNGSRRLRELEKEGYIESRLVKGKRGENLVEYRYRELEPMPPAKPQTRVEGFQHIRNML